MPHIRSIREFQDQQAVLSRAELAAHLRGEAVRDTAKRAVAAGIRRAAGDGRSLLGGDEADPMQRQRGIGALFDRRA